MSLKRIFLYGFIIGGICFLAGFIGPIILDPDANQGPLLGIFITGPLGFVLGIVIGFVVSAIKARRPDFKDPLQKLLDRL